MVPAILEKVIGRVKTSLSKLLCEMFMAKEELRGSLDKLINFMLKKFEGVLTENETKEVVKFVDHLQIIPFAAVWGKEQFAFLEHSEVELRHPNIERLLMKNKTFTYELKRVALRSIEAPSAQSIALFAKLVLHQEVVTSLLQVKVPCDEFITKAIHAHY